MDDKLLDQLRKLCGEPGPEDGAPRRRARKRRTGGDRKLLQLCGVVCRTVDLALGASSDPILQACWVESVKPAPDARCVRVRIQTHDRVSIEVLEATLRASASHLRQEVAHALQRRRTPRLLLEWAGPPKL